MKKIARIILFVLIVNLFSSIAYAGLGDFPRPTSIEPISVSEMAEY